MANLRGVQQSCISFQDIIRDKTCCARKKCSILLSLWRCIYYVQQTRVFLLKQKLHYVSSAAFGGNYLWNFFFSNKKNEMFWKDSFSFSSTVFLLRCLLMNWRERQKNALLNLILMVQVCVCDEGDVGVWLDVFFLVLDWGGGAWCQRTGDWPKNWGRVLRVYRHAHANTHTHTLSRSLSLCLFLSFSLPLHTHINMYTDTCHNLPCFCKNDTTYKRVAFKCIYTLHMYLYIYI